LATTKDGQRTEGENIGAVVTEVSERMSVLVREEIELAKAEMSEKATSMAKGAVAVGAGAMFAVFVLIYALTALAWGINAIVLDNLGNIWIGFLIVSVFVLLVAIGAFLFAWRKLRVGPPTPEMAIDEARKIRETVAVKTGEGS
jgi:uncharacterized small protein (DUF1192 family)